MKTIHRIMNDALTAEEYKNFCRNINPSRVKEMIDDGYQKPNMILGCGFDWDNSRQGICYWGNIQDRLNKVHKVN